MGASHESRLTDQVRLIVVESPDIAAPLVGALDVADIGIWMWLEAERALYFSPRVLDLLGLPREPHADLLARFMRGVYPDDQGAVRALLKREAASGPFEIRYRFTPPGGPLRWIEDRGRVERAGSGELIRQGGVIRDVTREVGREAEQRQADARLDALLNALPFAVWSRSGPELAVSHQNAAAIATWGDLRGSTLSEAPPDVRAVWQGHIADVMTGQVVRSRYEYARHGDRRIMHDLLAPVVVDDAIWGVVGVGIDVTDEEVARTRAQETHKLESLGVLAGGIAHHFNNLLTAILGNASLLRLEYDESPVTAGPLDEIESAARRAAELCRQMLAYAGRGRVALEPLDLNHLIRGIEALLSVSVADHTRLEIHLSPQLPLVLADETQLHQLLMSLVINAGEALRDGVGTISITTTSAHRTSRELAATVFSPELPAGEYVTLAVSDTGDGMTEETRARIFDPFFSTRLTGRGLGLAAVAGIVRAHQGALLVESQQGRGSRFEVMLPVYRGAVTPRAKPMFLDGSDDETTAHAGGTILVIDDELGVRTLARSVLERSGYCVILAEEGAGGIELLRERGDEVRLVMIDLTMPGLDGYATLHTMRKLRPDVPAVIMSGYRPSDTTDSLPHEFLQKPFTPAALRALVARILR